MAARKKKVSNSSISILSCFPQGYSPRPNQVTILKQIEENWDKADVFVIDAPVAAGKSHIAATISQYAWKRYGDKTSLCVPNNLLLKQYQETFPYIASVNRQSSYKCIEDRAQQFNCKTSKKHKGYFCTGCPYTQALRKMQAMPISILNYHSYIAYKVYRPVVIFDEAHNLLNTIGTAAASKIWHHDYHYPSWVKDYRSLHSWVSKELAADRIGDMLPPKVAKLRTLLEELESNRTTRLYTKGSALYRYEERDCILSSPVDISEEPPLFWPTKVRKLFMLSATFNSRDIKELGLNKKRVCYVNSPSAIPKENRPCVVHSDLNMSYKYQEANLPKLCEFILKFMEEHPDKGFIHAPYALARKLESKLDHPRLIFHITSDKIAKFNHFKETEGTIMVGSGMYEGVSLDGDMARWQLICKVPWPSLSEPAMEYLAKEDSEFYANRTIKDIVQTYGRVCRGPEDYGETHILDSSFGRLLKQYGYLFPRWFSEAVKTN